MTSGPIPLPIFELHGNGEPSFEHPICKGYHWHNTRIPERMGEVPSAAWKSAWLLDENNAEIRRLLITEIGYERICRELAATKIDKYREYELLKIKQDVDVEPIVLLSMTCPSTGHKHVLRVPPEMTKAEDAITWCNWGIKPSEFRVEH